MKAGAVMSDLKITKIETIRLSYRYSEEERWQCPGWTTLQRNATLVRVWTNKGVHGVGEVGEDSCIPQSVSSIIDEHFEGMLIGEDPFNVEKLWRKMFMRSLHWGRKGGAIKIISGIEIALWDIIGKELNRPVYELLGGVCRDKIRVYASAGMTNSEDELIEEVLRHKDQGYTAMKMRIGSDPKGDVEKVLRVRDAIGTKVDLMVDAGMCYVDAAWDYNTALRVARGLERADLLWLEEPLINDDIEGYVRLAAEVDIPIAAGENEYTKYGFKELIAKRAVDIIQPDATRSGGIMEVKKIAAIADAFQMRMAPHIFTSGISLMANLHIIVSTPNAMIMEFDRTINPLRDELLVEPLQYKDGFVHYPAGIPGLGVCLTDELIDKFKFIPGEILDKPDFTCDYAF
jgi:L-alanine-DL-glutamate epimerase-like enolase superfamily enzyme